MRCDSKERRAKDLLQSITKCNHLNHIFKFLNRFSKLHVEFEPNPRTKSTAASNSCTAPTDKPTRRSHRHSSLSRYCVSSEEQRHSHAQDLSSSATLPHRLSHRKTCLGIHGVERGMSLRRELPAPALEQGCETIRLQNLVEESWMLSAILGRRRRRF